MRLRVVVTLTAFLVGLLPTIVTSEPADFAFRFRYGCGSLETLDTFTGVFTRFSKPAISIPVRLSEAEMSKIYQAIEAIRFFDVPYYFTGVDGFRRSMTEPAMNYELEVRSLGRTHAVAWLDYDAKPATEQAKQLREMFSMMVALIRDHPEVKRLPMACCCL